MSFCRIRISDTQGGFTDLRLVGTLAGWNSSSVLWFSSTFIMCMFVNKGFSSEYTLIYVTFLWGKKKKHRMQYQYDTTNTGLPLYVGGYFFTNCPRPDTCMTWICFNRLSSLFKTSPLPCSTPRLFVSSCLHAYIHFTF